MKPLHSLPRPDQPGKAPESFEPLLAPLALSRVSPPEALNVLTQARACNALRDARNYRSALDTLVAKLDSAAQTARAGAKHLATWLKPRADAGVVEATSNNET